MKLQTADDRNPANSRVATLKATFTENLALIDCAAQIFADNHPRQTRSDFAKGYLRRPSVEALRYLWRTGTAETRWVVALRVGLWLRRADAAEVAKRVQVRELEREAAIATIPD